MAQWAPCSALNEMSGVVWLPRLIEKARRCEQSGGSRLFDGYCYGDNDFIDKMVLAFLRTNDATVSALVREHASDEEVARILVERSGHTASECEQFSRQMRRKLADFILIEADEGRVGGFKGALVKFLYNNAMMPIVYRMFARDESKRTSAMSGS